MPTDTEGVRVNEIRHKLSLRASATGEIVLDDVRLPSDAALPGATGLRAPLSCLTEARQGIAWGALGAARECLETAIAYAGERAQFGRPIAGFQLTQAKLADMALELQKGFSWPALARLADAGGCARAGHVAKVNNEGSARDCRSADDPRANGISRSTRCYARHNRESVLDLRGNRRSAIRDANGSRDVAFS